MTLPTGTVPFGIVAADFTKDGGLDRATADGTTSGDIGAATVLLNEPVVGLMPSSLSFGSQKVGKTSSPEIVTLTNPGATPFKPGTITVTGDFAETNNCTAKLTSGKDCTINVTFTLTLTGKRTGTLTIKDKALTSPQKIKLAGTGT